MQMTKFQLVALIQIIPVYTVGGGIDNLLIR